MYLNTCIVKMVLFKIGHQNSMDSRELDSKSTLLKCHFNNTRIYYIDWCLRVYGNCVCVSHSTLSVVNIISFHFNGF